MGMLRLCGSWGEAASRWKLLLAWHSEAGLVHSLPPCFKLPPIEKMRASIAGPASVDDLDKLNDI